VVLNHGIFKEISMKKSLIALAVLAASGAASAQSSVTLYGIADVWLGKSKGTVTLDGVSESASRTTLDSGGISGSRFGLKGSEDLGGGLKANFMLEQGFDISNGTQATPGVAFSRSSWVGLSGGFGAVTLGKDYSAYDDVRAPLNNTFDSAFTASGWFGYNGLPNNQIKYVSPSFGGFTGSLAYGLGEDKTATTSAGSVTSFNLQYAAGPMTVAFGHQTEKTGATLGLGALTGLNTTLVALGEAPIAVAAGSKAKYNLIGGSYDLGVAKLLASFNTLKFSEPGATDNLKANEFQIGADIPLSPALTLAVGYGQSKLKEGSVSLWKTKAYSAAVMYAMSKRTSFYAGFNNTKLTLDAAQGDASVKGTLYAAGIRHAF
jgi:predicted porin